MALAARSLPHQTFAHLSRNAILGKIRLEPRRKHYRRPKRYPPPGACAARRQRAGRASAQRATVRQFVDLGCHAAEVYGRRR
jgi:hypothetical protein